ncbi:hypothetical protein BH10ACT10_BH10ACT10_02120 [soil metagenome]
MTSTFPPAVYDEIADLYDGSRGGVERGRRFAAAISPLLAPGGPCIELGIGTGLVASGLTELGHDVIGIDLSSGMLGYAAERLPGGVALARIGDLPFAEGSAANCYAIWVLHMVSDLAGALRDIHSTLLPGGRLVTCSVSNGASPDAIGQIVNPMQNALIGEAKTKRDTSHELSALATDAGFVPVPGTHQVVQSYELAPAAIARTIEQRGFSNLKDVEDERWESIVVPAIERLRGLPDPQRPIVRDTIHELLAFTRS